ncbi:acyl-CoA dehydrogenase family protein [Actinomadura rupiterrae]|uniref:acyl-CoA dehydrogenase family protein n=1 Tax=Actinomadura rupiterrae TaxID=559627 RepID=UPI0020A2C938|nr:acyl-CoA dehydrogenase family protein [Actinomadura rupiterrae]MCP2336427.1 alkylation response protein AidB-like acyl-CoA dehydrogenase [Actinomadura rupiterrae]
MGLVETEELRELRAMLRRFFAEHAPVAEARRQMATRDGFDRELWRRMAGELGLQGLAVPEEHGGSGFGVRELAVVFEEMGRVLYCGPFLATVGLALPALLAAGATDDLPGIADGTTIATLAWTEDDRWAAPPAMTCEDGRLTGTKTYVLDGHTADLVLVTARTGTSTGTGTDTGSGSGTGVALFAVDGDAPGLTRTPLPTLDQTRKLARLHFENVDALLISSDAEAVLARARDVAAALLAAEQVGGAERALQMTVDYAKVREQFGRPIGSFQAVKHRCADMFVQVESARSAMLNAAAAADDSPGELPVAAALAKAFCSDAYFHVAGETIQLHGGIGFTWEHDAHLYFKRAKSSQELFGPPAMHRNRLADLVGITGAAAAP